jgi:hypothetical protein
MNRNRKRVVIAAAAVVMLLAAGSCNDINKQSAPVSLVVTNTQNLHLLDLAGDPTGSTKCQQTIAVVHLQAIQLQSPSTTNPNITPANLDQVKIDRYRVSYVRVDGGHLVPAPFVRSTSSLIGINGTADASNFQAFDPNALNQAPFAALLPQNGGVDPETHKPIITMDVILEVFGQTLAGEPVSGSTRLTLDFCFSCGGCS